MWNIQFFVAMSRLFAVLFVFFVLSVVVESKSRQGVFNFYGL